MKRVNRIVRCIQQRLSQNQSGFTLPELLMAVVISGIIVGALASSFLVSATAVTSSKQRLNESHDAQQVSAYFVSDAANASYFSASTPPAVMAGCPDFGAGHNVGLFRWTEGSPSVTKDAFYGTTGSPAELVRRYCEGGVQQYQVSLVKNIGSTAPVVTCETAPCTAVSPYLQLNVQEASNAYSYAVRSDPRTTPPGPTGPMNGYAIYVSGDLTLGGTNTAVDVPAGVVAVGGTSSCNSGSSLSADDGFYGSGCTGQQRGTLPPDPLAGVPAPSEPADSTTTPPNNSYVPPNGAGCGSSMPTYLPGRYAVNNKMADGCLASGTYFFKVGATFSNLRSAPGGVHIYVESGGIDLSGNTTLQPITTQTFPQANITIFLGRASNDIVKTNDPMTVNGVIYAPAGTLWVASSSGDLSAGGINVNQLRFSGNSGGLVILGF